MFTRAYLYHVYMHVIHVRNRYACVNVVLVCHCDHEIWSYVLQTATQLVKIGLTDLSGKSPRALSSSEKTVR